MYNFEQWVRARGISERETLHTVYHSERRVETRERILIP